MTHAILSGTIGGLIALLGAYFLASSWHSPERRAFSWLCLSASLWFLSYAAMEATSNRYIALFFARLGHTGVIFVPICYLHFTSAFLHVRWLQPIYKAYYVLGIILLWLVWSLESFIPGVSKQSWGYYPIGSSLMLFEASLVILVVATCWSLFFRSLGASNRNQNFARYNQLKYCCFALVIFSLAGLDYLPKFGISYYPFGPVFTGGFILIVSYAILFHRLLDLTIVFRKSLVYSTLVAVMTGVYFGVVFLAERQMQGIIGYRSVIGSLLAGFAIAIGFNPLKDLVQQFVDRIFFKRSQVALAEENERLKHEITRSERLKAVSTLAAGMAHEIKNPLSAIKTFAEFLPERYADPAFREKFTKVMSQEVDKMNDLVHRLLEFAKPAPPKLQPVRLSGLIGETLQFLQGTLLKNHIRAETSLIEQDDALVDPSQLRQVFLNILLNSIDAMPTGGTIRVSSFQQNGYVDICFSDTGPGMPATAVAHAFDPFYTTKPEGTGLGLSVVHSIIREHGGRVTIASQPGKGTEVKIRLPIKGGTNGATAHSDRG